MKVLHVGCGSKKAGVLPEIYKDYKEVRLDIDEKVEPDFCCSIIDMNLVPSNNYDSIFSCHNLEHLHPFDVVKAIQEFYRVLNDTGFVFIKVPDLQKIAELILSSPSGCMDVAYESEAGSITPLDMLYGYRPFTYTNKYMEHKCAFTDVTLASLLKELGFNQVITRRNGFDVEVIATKTEQNINSILVKI